VLILNVAVAPRADAVTDEEIYTGLRFPLQPPGARLAAMGGAGLALVDDAAAARVNPARLGAINAPEIVIEGSMRSSSTVSTDSDFTRFDPSINPFAGTGFSTTVTDDGRTAPAYFSYAHPLKVLSRPLVVAFSRFQAVDVSLDARSASRTTPLSAPPVPSGGDNVLRISEGQLDAEVVLYDLAAGWRLTPTFAVGASLTAGRLSLSSETTGLLSDPLQFTGPGMSDPRFSGPAAAPLSRTRSDGTDTDFAFSFGAWWRPHPAVSVGTTYHRGPRFGIPATSRDLSAMTRERFTNVVKQPDTEAAGIVWTPFYRSASANLQTLTFALDLERIEYGDVLEGLRAGENVLTRSDFVRRVEYTADDALETHLGVEYRQSFLTWTLALRAGGYTEHDAGLRLSSASGDVGALQGQSRAMEEDGFLPGQHTRAHATFGAGARFYSLGFDVALDVSEHVHQLAASMTWRFGDGR